MSASGVATTAALALLFLGAARYKEAPEGPDTAMLVFAKGYTPHVGQGSGVFYYMSTDACANWAIARDFWYSI